MLYARLIPDSPGVVPPGVSSSMAVKIFSFSAPLVVFSIMPVMPPYTTIATESFALRLLTNKRNADFNKGKPVGHIHRAGNIDQKNKMTGWQCLEVQFFGGKINIK